jgi:predicted deacylase
MCTVSKAARSGPNALVVALTHGNEICGAIAIDRLMKMGLRPTRGTLTLAFANVAAFARFDAVNPFASRFVDEDFNRVWTADGAGWIARERRAASSARAEAVRRCGRLRARHPLDARVEPSR